MFPAPRRPPKKPQGLVPDVEAQVQSAARRDAEKHLDGFVELQSLHLQSFCTTLHKASIVHPREKNLHHIPLRWRSPCT